MNKQTKVITGLSIGAILLFGVSAAAGAVGAAVLASESNTYTVDGLREKPYSSLDELRNDSSMVVQVTVASKKNAEDGGMPVTVSEARVDGVLWAATDGEWALRDSVEVADSINVYEYGYMDAKSESPRLTEGEYLLFVRALPGGDEFYITGVWSGIYSSSDTEPEFSQFFSDGTDQLPKSISLKALTAELAE